MDIIKSLNIETIISIISVLIAIISAGVSFYFSRNSKKYSEKSLQMIEQQYKLSINNTLNQYINEAVEAFKKIGTPIPYINSIPNLSTEEKEEIWQHCYIRYKRKPTEKNFLSTFLIINLLHKKGELLAEGLRKIRQTGGEITPILRI